MPSAAVPFPPIRSKIWYSSSLLNSVLPAYHKACSGGLRPEGGVSAARVERNHSSAAAIGRSDAWKRNDATDDGLSSIADATRALTRTPYGLELRIGSYVAARAALACMTRARTLL